jgi:hypothetical protein
MLGKPLQFTPGTSYDYSNFGYCVLGRIIKKVTGMTYEQFVQQNVLAPFGISDMKIGHTQLSQRAPGEVTYYDPLDGNTTSVFPGAGSVPWPYGGFYIEAMDSHGGWIASPIDLMRFVVGLDGKASSTLLNSTMMQQLLARPTTGYWDNSAYWYASGWLVRPSGPDANWWHTGSLPGCASEIVRDNTGIGVDFAVVFNTRTSDSNTFQSQVDSGLQQVIGQMTHWPGQDLFSLYEPPITPTTTTTTATASTSSIGGVTTTTTLSSTTNTASTGTLSTSSATMTSGGPSTTSSSAVSSVTTPSTTGVSSTSNISTTLTGYQTPVGALTSNTLLGAVVITTIPIAVVALVVQWLRRRRRGAGVVGGAPTVARDVCRNCGPPLAPGERFCSNCGRKAG